MEFFENEFANKITNSKNNNFFKMITSFIDKDKMYMATLMSAFSIWHHFDQREDVTKEKLIEESLVCYNEFILAEKIFNNLVYDKEFLVLCDHSGQSQKYEINFKKYITSDISEFIQYKSYIHK